MSLYFLSIPNPGRLASHYFHDSSQASSNSHQTTVLVKLKHRGDEIKEHRAYEIKANKGGRVNGMPASFYNSWDSYFITILLQYANIAPIFNPKAPKISTIAEVRGHLVSPTAK